MYLSHLVKKPSEISPQRLYRAVFEKIRKVNPIWKVVLASNLLIS